MLGQSCCSVPALGGVKAGGQDGRSSVATVQHDLKNAYMYRQIDRQTPTRRRDERQKGYGSIASSGYERLGAQPSPLTQKIPASPWLCATAANNDGDVSPPSESSTDSPLPQKRCRGGLCSFQKSAGHSKWL